MIQPHDLPEQLVTGASAEDRRVELIDAISALNRAIHAALHEFTNRAAGHWVSGVTVRPGLNEDGSIFYDLSIQVDEVPKKE